MAAGLALATDFLLPTGCRCLSESLIACISFSLAARSGFVGGCAAEGENGFFDPAPPAPLPALLPAPLPLSPGESSDSEPLLFDESSSSDAAGRAAGRAGGALTDEAAAAPLAPAAFFCPGSSPKSEDESLFDDSSSDAAGRGFCALAGAFAAAPLAGAFAAAPARCGGGERSESEEATETETESVASVLSSSSKGLAPPRPLPRWSGASSLRALPRPRPRRGLAGGLP